MNRPRDIEAKIYFLTEAEGGRSKPSLNDYRPQFYYNGHDWDVRLEYPDAEKAFPGETVRANIAFLSPEEHTGVIYVGMEFLVREGVRNVAKGKVTKIIELEQSAAHDT